MTPAEHLALHRTSMAKVDLRIVHSDYAYNDVKLPPFEAFEEAAKSPDPQASFHGLWVVMKMTQ